MANTLKIKRGTAATIPQGQLAEPLFTTDTYDLYIGKGAGGNQRIQNYIASGTSSQFLKGDGSLDSTTYQATSEKGQNNGYASLDSGGKVPVAQLPNSIMEYKGTWDASTNTPTLADGTGNAGDVYIVSVGGTQNLGSGSITFAAGDWVVYSGSVWQKSINSNAVASVNGQTGAVVLYTDDISEDGSPTNLWFTNARARAAISLTTNNTSGSATYDNSTGVLNIPQYQGVLTNPVTGTGTNNEIAYFNTTGSTISSLSTATYPSLTELSYVKGVTSAIQTQLNAKEPTVTKGNLTETTSSVLTITGGTGAVIGSGTTIAVASAGATQAGVVTTGTQTFAGAKTFSSNVTSTAFIPTGSTVPTNGMYLPSSNTLGLSANSTKVIEISDSGRVSIGATSPTTDALTVFGAITTTNGGAITAAGTISSGSTISSGLNITATSTISGSALIPTGTTAPTVGMYLVSGTSTLNGVLGFSTNSTKRLEINNSTGDATFTNNISAANLSGTNTGDQTLAGLGGVPTSRTITINGTSFDLSANRTYTVGTIGGSGSSGYVSKFTGSTTIGNSLIYDNGVRAISVGNSSTNPWASPFYVIEGGSYGQFLGYQTNAAAIKLGVNAYFNGSNYIYTNSNLGIAILDLTGDATNASLNYYTAPAGTAGSAATLSPRFIIDSSGNGYFVESLGIGFTSGAPNGRIDFRNPANAIIVGKNTTGGTNTYSSIRLTTANSGGVGDSIGEIRGLSTNVNNRDTALTFLTSEGSAGQTEKMRITSGGNVGINVTPSAWGSTWKAIQINAQASIAAENDFLNLSVNAYNDGTNWKRLATGVATNYYQVSGVHVWRYVGSDSAGTNITWSEAMRITSGGNVLIGTTDNTAAYRLNVSVNGGSSYIGVTNQAGGTGDRYLRIGFGTGATVASIQGTRVNVADDVNLALQPDGGNVGIGVTNPGVKLHVVASGAAVATFASSAANGGWIRFARNTSSIYGYAGSGYELVTGGANTDMALTTELGNLLFATDQGKERMRISSVGTVIVKGQSDDIVQVGDSISGHNAYLQLKAGTSANAYVNSTGSGSLIFGANGAASNHMMINSDGNLLFNGTSNPGGAGNIYIGNSGSLPGTPSGGGVLYVQGGALKFRGSSGTITTIANA